MPWWEWRGKAPDGGAVPAAQTDSLEPDGPHDPRDAFVLDPYPLVAEFGGDPGGAVGAVGVLMDLAYPGCEPGFNGLPGRPCGRGAAPVLEARAGDPKDVAQPLHAEPALVVVNELAAVLQRVSVAKYRAALRRMSRSSSSARIFFRATANSA